jgi:hypothetical protein
MVLGIHIEEGGDRVKAVLAGDRTPAGDLKVGIHESRWLVPNDFGVSERGFI